MPQSELEQEGRLWLLSVAGPRVKDSLSSNFCPREDWLKVMGDLRISCCVNNAVLVRASLFQPKLALIGEFLRDDQA